MRALLKKPLRLLPLLAMLIVWACTLSETIEDQYLVWHLSENLKDYKRVDIKLVDAQDASILYEQIWNDSLPDPLNFKKHRLGRAKGKNFVIQIRCYNAAGELALSKDVKVEGNTQKISITLLSDPRLFGLSLSGGVLAPPFRPDVTAYTAQVDSALGSVSLTASPMDAANSLSIEQVKSAWNTAINKPLKVGANVIVLDVLDKDGNIVKTYQVTVTRGRPVDPGDVKSVSLPVHDTLLYAGDGPITLVPTVDPAGASLQWSSHKPEVARVDGNGKVTPMEAGETYVVVKAGNHADSALVRVKRDVPQINAGANIGVNVNTEVVFPISIVNHHGTIVSFKYDLDGDGQWDSADTATVPAQLKYTYTAVKTYTARFYLVDSEGNPGGTTRTISVFAEGSLRVVITYPGKDTTVTKSPITVLYTVNDVPFSRVVELDEGRKRVVIDTTVGAKRDSAVIHITLDTTPPSAPAVSSTTFASPFRPIWTWTGASTGGGGGFRYRLDNPVLDSATPVGVKMYTPASDLGAGEHTLYVQERDSVGNWSESGMAKVSLNAADVTPPNPPNVKGTSPTGLAPKWTWSTGGGGSGDYKYKLGDTAMAGVAETRDTAFTLTTAPASGTNYVLYVKERDAAGNWSTPSSRSILYDITKPSVAIVSPQASGTYYTKAGTLAFSGTASGPSANTITKVTYSVNGGSPSDASLSNGAWTVASITLTDNATTTVTFSAIDNAGNHGEATLQVLRDNLAPAAPTLISSPPTPSNAVKGTWAWNAGTDPAGGSGLSGRFRYSLDGGATWTDSNLTVAKDVPLPEGIAVIFSVQEQDMAGNWSTSASSVIAVDRSKPKVAVTAPASGGTQTSIHATLTGTVSDVGGAGVASVALSGLKTGTVNATVTGGTWSSGDVTLNSGAVTVIVKVTDNVGNVDSVTWNATVNPKAPAVFLSAPAHGFATNMDTVTVKYKVDDGPLKDTLVTLTKDGANLLTIYSPKNEAGLIGSDTITVIRDKTGPNPPTLIPMARTFSKVDPTWNFNSNGDNSGGSGVTTAWNYKITDRITSAAVTSGNITSTSTGSGTFTWTSAPEGDYIVMVRQQDKAGNWGAYSPFSNMVVDKTLPSVTLSAPANGFVTSLNGVSLTCLIDGATTTVNQGLTAGANTLTCTKTDSAGNVNTKTATVYYVPNTIFVMKGGNGNGTSWSSPLGSIQTAIQGATSGKQVWIAAGRYSTEPGLNGIQVPGGVAIYGSFPVAGTAKSISDRTFGANDTTYLQKGHTYDKLVHIEGTEAAPKQTITIDGLQFSQGEGVVGIDMMYAKGITLKNLVFRQISPSLGAGRGLSGYFADFTIDNGLFTGFAHENTVFGASGGSMTMSNCTFTGNSAYSTGGKPSHVFLDYSTKATLLNNKFLDPPPSNDGVTPGWTIRWGLIGPTGSMDITNCTFKGGDSPDDLIENYNLRVNYSGNTFNP